MKPQSLRLRLVAGGAVAIALALAIAGAGLTYFFERHISRNVADDLNVHLRQLLAGIEISAEGRLQATRPPVDPRFSTPLSGLYWQAGIDGQAPIRSRSLWDNTLSLALDELAPGDIHRHELPGPSATRLLVVEQGIIMEAGGKQRPIRVAVAVDRAGVARARAAFANDLAVSLPLFGLVLALAMWIQIGLGLRPLDALRRGIAQIKEGKTQHIASTVPSEVQPLVDELNDLLDFQKNEIQRARDRAADLAHGLKTPLAALAADARRLRDKNEHGIADGIEAIGESMRRHVERELTRAQVRGSVRSNPPSELLVLPIVESLIVTLSRTPDGGRVRFDLRVDDDQSIAMDRDDLAEVLGNLLENAARFARTSIAVTCFSEDGLTRLSVEDDGPGISRDTLGKMIERGRRMDERGSGTGIGLAIVQDVLDAYGRKLVLCSSGLGGLKAQF